MEARDEDLIIPVLPVIFGLLGFMIGRLVGSLFGHEVIVGLIFAGIFVAVVIKAMIIVINDAKKDEGEREIRFY